MFSQDISKEDRLKAVEMRIEAARFEEAPPPFASEAHQELDQLLASAPDWLLADVSRAFFGGWAAMSGAQKIIGEAGKQMGLERLPWATSQIDLRTAARMRAHRCDADRMLDALLSIQNYENDLLNTTDKGARTSRRAHLKIRAGRMYTLADALADERRDRQRALEKASSTDISVSDAGPRTHADLKALFSGREINCGEGRVLRVATPKEAREIADAWEDGWLSMSPEHAASGTVAGKQYRREQACRMSESANMLCVFGPEGKPVGSIAISPVSDKEAELGWFVRAGHRGLGIASSSVSAVLRELADAGFERFGAMTLVKNDDSIRLMERLGFSRREDEVVVGTDIDWIGMTADAKDILARLDGTRSGNCAPLSATSRGG